MVAVAHWVRATGEGGGEWVLSECFLGWKEGEAEAGDGRKERWRTAKERGREIPGEHFSSNGNGFMWQSRQNYNFFGSVQATKLNELRLL